MQNRKKDKQRLRANVCAGLVATLLLVAATAMAAPSRDNDTVQWMRAVRANHVDAVRAMVERGRDVNARVAGDGTALIVASRRGELPMVDALLALGADVHQVSIGDGNPLIAASVNGRLAVVERLIAAGAHVNATVPDDETALIGAVRAGHLDVARYLVAQGADVNLGAMANGNVWRTPLNQARTQAMRAFLRSRGATRGGHAG